MSTSIPIHKATLIAEFGIKLKSIFPNGTTESHPVEYSHTDDYYIFGIIKDGQCNLNIDFKDYQCTRGDIIIIKPGQVHRFVSSDNLYADLIIIDTSFIDIHDKNILDEYILNVNLFNLDEKIFENIKSIIAIIKNQFTACGTTNKNIIQHLTCALIGIITNNIKFENNIYGNKRHLELTIKFKSLIGLYIALNRSPSYYADLMNISTSYLNEAVKNITGINVSSNLQNEIILRAKRQLIFTPKSIKEIALDLGFEDIAYFTRLFTKVSGISPSLFKNNYLKYI